MLHHKQYFKAQCFFCGGKKCRHEREDTTIHTSHTQQALRGLNSHWVTHDIIASQRPSNRLIMEYDIIAQFKEHNITDIINLQEQYEHPNCGDGILENGFSYDPELFMNANVHYYNFLIQDMESPSIKLIINIMQLMHGALKKKNRAFFIHCHAGRGRTGLLIACYLLWDQRFSSAKDAIEFVRKRRPKSIQTSGQVKFIYKFDKYLKNMWTVYVGLSPFQNTFSVRNLLDKSAKSSTKTGSSTLLRSTLESKQSLDTVVYKSFSYGNLNTLEKTYLEYFAQNEDSIDESSSSNEVQSFDDTNLQRHTSLDSLDKSIRQKVNPSKTIALSELLERQRLFLHGSEGRQLFNLPKLVFIVSNQLQKIISNSNEIEQENILVQLVTSIYDNFCTNDLKAEVKRLKEMINTNKWGEVETMSNASILMRLLIDFLDQLRDPILSTYTLLKSNDVDPSDLISLLHSVPSPESNIFIEVSRILGTFTLDESHPNAKELFNLLGNKLSRGEAEVSTLLKLACNNVELLKKTNRELLLERDRRDSLNIAYSTYSSNSTSSISLTPPTQKNDNSQ